MRFTHLHVHTHYSLLDGLPKIPELVKKAKEYGMTSLAITDHGVMYGAIEFYQECKKNNIKPIIGSEVYIAKNGRFKKQTKDDAKRYHLVLLARNNIGYKNLLKLTSIAHLEGMYYKPRIDYEVLEKYSDGLIASSACLQGHIPVLIREGNLEKAEEVAKYYEKIFGKGNFYLEIQCHPNIKEQREVNLEIIKLSKKTGIPLVATNDTHYLDKEDKYAQDVLLCLQTKKKQKDTDRICMLQDDFCFFSQEEMIERLKQYPYEAIENTKKIADKCNVEIKLGEIKLPFFPIPNNASAQDYLSDLCFKNFKEKIKEKDSSIKLYKDRLEYELSIIKKTGFASYFLIVSDFVNWAKSNGIVVGPGRGSAAGSLVSYLLGITNIDPLKYDLVFERFLNPERISMPDIDLDFADTRREEIIEYVKRKYGEDRVSQIITFGTMAARAAVRDVARVFDFPYSFGDKIAKAIPLFMNLEKALSVSPDLKEIYKNDPNAKKVIDYAKKLEGVVRHSSTHACGVLITKNPLTEVVPLQYASSSDKTIISQYSLHPVEDLGLLKMDFLGLRNLTIIENALNIIKNIHNIEIDINKIPLDDKKTYRIFQKGETTSVFQFESNGMKKYLHELKPTEFEDIIAMVALYRPGPMEWIPEYIAGKKGRKEITYLHPKLESILKKTYGVIIYQEQIMQIARDLANFTMGEADILRKAVGKKNSKLLIQQKNKFINGCVNNGIEKKLAEKIFSFIEPFARYGFNRSHAVCYAMIGYQTAYLKANYPVEFMAAVLSANQENIDKTVIEIKDCNNMGIDVLPPEINESYEDFTVVKTNNKDSKKFDKNNYKTIRFGLNAIKNVGSHISKIIIKERKANGHYKNIADFLERVQDKDLNKKSLESLIKAGAFDNFAKREVLLANLENMLSYAREVSSAVDNRQSSLFSNNPEISTGLQLKLEYVKEIDQKIKLKWEKDLLGLYISRHPFKDYSQYVKGFITSLIDLKTNNNKITIIAGIIVNIQKKITRNNEYMLFVKIEDDITSVECLIFPKLFKNTTEIWQEGQAVIISGRVSDKDGEVKFLAEKAELLKIDKVREIVKRLNPSLFNRNFSDDFSFQNNNTADYNSNKNFNTFIKPKINLLDGKVEISMPLNYNKETLRNLKEIFLNKPGANQVVFVIKSKGKQKKLATPYKIALDDEVKTEIENLTNKKIEIK